MITERNLLPGPIIRINPTEIHISDPYFYETAYSSSKPRDKLPKFENRAGLRNAAVNTVKHDLHHGRRMALKSYFSKREINDFAPHIQLCVDRLCARLLGEYKGTSKVVTLNDAWTSFATDIVIFYAFAWSYDTLEHPDFVNPFTKALSNMVDSIHWIAHFPLMMTFLQSVPESVVGLINPAMKSVFQFHNVR